MPRIRTIKPEFFQDEKLAPLSALDRLVFLGLISMADDAGRLLDNVKVIDAFIFPCSDDSSATSLRKLHDLSRIVRYTSESGQKLIQIRNWSEHQKVEKPNRHVLPAPSAEDLTPSAVTSVGEDSPNIRGGVGEESGNVPRYDLGPTTNDLGPTTEKHSAAGASVSAERVRDPDAPDRRQKPRRRSRVAAVPDAGKPERETWLTPARDAWEDTFGPGSFDCGRAAKTLSPLYRAGIEPDEIGRRLREYVSRKRNTGYCRLDDFAAHHGEYVPTDRGPALLEGGVMSDWLERETRPPGMDAPRGRMAS